jgi:[acyl-carrier-protein] S-malonyltransferase
MFTKAIFLFPGQGAQYTGMGLDFLKEGGSEAAGLFEAASRVMGRDMQALLQSDGETLKASDIAQPTVTLVNLAALAFLRGKGIEPVAAAGHSLGEYAALACAGVISVGDCLRLVAERGKAMQVCCAALPKGSGMMAVLGLLPEDVSALVEKWNIPRLYAANYNSHKQTVVSGDAAALQEAASRFKEEGKTSGRRIRTVPLPVAGPFHCPLMQDAAAAFKPVLESVAFHDPVLPFYSNVSGKIIKTGKEAQAMALQQITSPVRWTEELAGLQAVHGGVVALEAGPGRTLQGLWRDSGAAAPCYTAGTVEDIGKLGGNDAA